VLLVLDSLVIAAALVGMFSSTCLRYVWPKSSWSGQGVWIGDGLLGYISYVAINPEFTGARTYPKPLSWSIGSPLDYSRSTLPEWGTDIFGVRYFEFPIWILAVVLSTPFVLFVLRWYRARARARTGRCVPCGYDLTGNISGQCPECGCPISR
jgi:hypothetical protein